MTKGYIIKQYIVKHKYIIKNGGQKTRTDNLQKKYKTYLTMRRQSLISL